MVCFVILVLVFWRVGRVVMQRTRNPSNRLIPARRFKSCTLLIISIRAVWCFAGKRHSERRLFFSEIMSLLLLANAKLKARLLWALSMTYLACLVQSIGSVQSRSFVDFFRLHIEACSRLSLSKVFVVVMIRHHWSCQQSCRYHWTNRLLNCSHDQLNLLFKPVQNAIH